MEVLTMEENKIPAIIKVKTDVLKESYKHTLELLDSYDHQTLMCPMGMYYDGNETIEEEVVNMLYDMIKNLVWNLKLNQWYGNEIRYLYLLGGRWKSRVYQRHQGAKKDSDSWKSRCKRCI